MMLELYSSGLKDTDFDGRCVDMTRMGLIINVCFCHHLVLKEHRFSLKALLQHMFPLLFQLPIKMTSNGCTFLQ